MATRIIIVDDHRMIRQGLKVLLEHEPQMQVVGEGENGREAIDLARELSPHIVVMDMDMPELNGVDATRRICTDMPQIKVIALSMHGDRKVISRMLQAGASGFLLKDCAFDELADAIRTVMGGGTYLAKEVASIVVDDYVRKLDVNEVSKEPMLTPKEREVLQMIAEGKSTKEVAASLHVSVKTIESHRKNIMDRLNIKSIAELTKYAIREGLTSLDH